MTASAAAVTPAPAPGAPASPPARLRIARRNTSPGRVAAHLGQAARDPCGFDPSATTDMPSSCASEMVARMIFTPPYPSRRHTNDCRSQFGERQALSESSDEWPVAEVVDRQADPLMRNRVSTSAASTGSAHDHALGGFRRSVRRAPRSAGAACLRSGPAAPVASAKGEDVHNVQRIASLKPAAGGRRTAVLITRQRHDSGRGLGQGDEHEQVAAEPSRRHGASGPAPPPLDGGRCAA